MKEMICLLWTLRRKFKALNYRGFSSCFCYGELYLCKCKDCFLSRWEQAEGLPDRLYWDCIQSKYIFF